MTEQDYNHLEDLLAKLGQALGRQYCIIPGYVHDGPYLATYTPLKPYQVQFGKESIEYQVTAIDLKTAVEKIKANQKP